MRLRVATRGALSIAAALAAEWAFVEGTHALEVHAPPGASAAVVAAAAAQRHEILVVALLLGGLVGMLAGFNGNETTGGAQLVTSGFIACGVAATLPLGLALGTHRAVALVVMVVLLVVGAYGRRFGQRGAIAGLVAFIGYFYGFFLAVPLGVSAAGWLASEVGVGVGASVVVRVALFWPSAARDLRLALGTMCARVSTVVELARRRFDDDTPRLSRAMDRWLVRLGEASLIVDAQLARPGALEADRASAVQRWAFDTEVAATNVARLSARLASVRVGAPIPDDDCRVVRCALGDLASGDTGRARRQADALEALHRGRVRRADIDVDVLLRRFSHAVADLASLLEDSPTRARQAALAPSGAAPVGTRPTWRVSAGGRGNELAPDAGPLSPAVGLRGGWLPGTADVSVEAAELPSARVRIAPYLRTTAQMAVAVTVAILAGDALDAQRFYWAVIAAVLALVGTNTVAEQLRKAAYRVLGTLAGVVAGTALVNAVGHHSVWTLVVVVGSMWVGMYFFRVNYALMAMAVTISLSQAYLSLGEFSNGLLWERLAETSVGAAAAMAAVVVVVPLRTRRVVDVSLAAVVDSVAALADAASDVLAGGAPDATAGLRSAGRAVDAAFQALVATAEPLRKVGWTGARDRLTRQLGAGTGARNYARNLVADVARSANEGLDLEMIDAGRAVLARSAGALSSRMRMEPGAHDVAYVRAAPYFVAAEPDSPSPRDAAQRDGAPARNLALRDLALLDEALAGLALATGMRTAYPDDDPSALRRTPGSGQRAADATREEG